jgi:hypothetical protein
MWRKEEIAGIFQKSGRPESLKTVSYERENNENDWQFQNAEPDLINSSEFRIVFYFPCVRRLIHPGHQ